MIVSWKNTFYCHTYYGHITRILEIAKETGYPFFCWNGVIYQTEGCKQTPYTVDNL